MKLIAKTSFIALWILGSFVLSAQAQSFGPDCKMSRGLRYNFFLSPESKTAGAFGVQADRLPPTVISQCRGAGGKVLGFGLGLRIPFVTSDTSNISFDGDYKKELCQVKNSPVNNLLGFDEKNRTVQSQFRLMRTCSYLEITHLDNRELNFNSDQKFCKMERLHNGKVIARGDFCYLQISPDLNIAVSVALEPKCLDQSFLDENGIKPQDIDTVLQAFVVEDETSIVTNNLIGSSRVRLTLMPSSKSIALTKDVGPEQPAFPEIFAADLHMGAISIRDSSGEDVKRTQFELSVFADSRTQEACTFNSTCVAPTDFQMPLVAEVEFSELKGRTKLFLDGWYAGNTLDPMLKSNWQGLFRLGRKMSEGVQLEVGKTYELKLNFYNPYDDFMMLVRGYEHILVDLTGLNGTAGLDAITPINSLRSLLGLPEMPPMPQIGRSDIEQELEKVRQVLSQISHMSVFPPFYKKMCDPSLATCVNANSTSKMLTLTAEFTVKGVNQATGEFILSNANIRRESPLLKAYSLMNMALPEMVCQ